MIKKYTDGVAVSLGVLVFSALMNTAYAKDFLCNARQGAADQLPVLDDACPIGQGDWGNKVTPADNMVFWIQCGMSRQPLSIAEASPLQQQVSSKIWMKKDGNEYRCLIGPYDSHVKVLTDLSRLRKVAGYHDAFVRVVHKTVPSSASTTPSDPVAESSSQANRHPGETVHPLPESSLAGIQVMRKAQIRNVQYVVPFLGKNKAQYYMEYDKPWNRLSYLDALNTCHVLKMRLASRSEWKILLASKVMEENDWPLYLPYWGDDYQGLFSNGNVRQLKSSSLLNVLCVR